MNLGVRRGRKIKQKTMIIFKSKDSMRIVAMALAAMWAIAAVHAEAPFGPVFTYQGEMLQDGEPVDDKSDFQFSLWDELEMAVNSDVEYRRRATHAQASSIHHISHVHLHPDRRGLAG